MKNIASLFFALMLTAGFARSQDTLKLNFDQAVNMALEKNIQIQEQKNNLEAAIAQKNQSLANYQPQITGYSGYNHSIGLQFSQVTAELYTTSSNYISSSITAGYRIFDGLGRLNTLKNSERLMESQQDEVEATRQLTIYNVATQYLQVLLDREIVNIDNENLNYQKTTLEQIKGFVTTGTHPLSDELTQNAHVKKAEVQKIKDENVLRLDKAKLSQSLLVTPGQVIDPQEPGWGFDAILAEDYKIEDLYQTALAHRPDYKKTITDQEAAHAALGIARSNHFPTLDMFYQYGTSYYSLNTNQLTGLPYSFAEQYFKADKQSIYGLQLNIPIFNNYKTIALKTQRRMQMENAELTEENTKYTLYQDVQNAYLNFKAAKDTYNATQAQYEAAVEAKKVQQESYTLGVSDLVQLSQATQTYVDAASSRAQAQYTLLFQNVMLNYATGTLNADNLH